MRLLLGVEAVNNDAIERHRSAYRTLEQLRTAFMRTADARFLFVQANEQPVRAGDELPSPVRLTPRDWVICSYLLLLGREPESEAVIATCLEVSNDGARFSLERLRHFLMTSHEFPLASHAPKAREPDTELSAGVALSVTDTTV